jgi:cytochrome P450
MAAALAAASLVLASSFRFSRLARFCLGKELVMLELVVVMKLLFAAFRNGVGKALKIL